MSLNIANRPRSWRAALRTLALASLFWGLNALATTFTTSLDRDSIGLGDNATLSLTFQGGSPAGTPSLPDIPGLHITYVGPSEQYTFVNGQSSSTVTHNYSVTADRPGVYTIPALSIDLDGAQLTSQPLKLSVAQPAAPSDAAVNSGAEVAFAKLVPPRKQMYVGEVATAELDIWLRDDVQNFGNLQIPSESADGFNVGKMAERPRRRVQKGNHVYTIVPIAITVTAIKTGTLSLGPFQAQMVIVLPSPNGGGDPFFRPFFNTGEQKQITLDTATETVQSLKLPPGAPPGFTGAVGEFRMSVSEGPTSVSAGDPITVHVRIEGRGALDSVTLPDFSGWNGFKTYPPTSKTEYTDQQSLEGVKTFEQIVTPQNTDVKELPPFSFSFFNPDAGAYQTLSQPALAITVRSAGSAPVPTMAAAKPAATEAAAAQSDIFPAKQELGPLVSLAPPLVTRPGFLALQSLPVLAFLAALGWRKRADHLANNPRLRRKRAVALLVEAGLADLRRFAAENNSGQFFATLFRLLQELLGERLDCPASAITESVVDERGAALAASPGALAGLRELFQMCNQAKYAPVRDPQELAAVAAKFAGVSRELNAAKT